MALVRMTYCSVCECERTHINGKCADCRTRENREAMAAWRAKTAEEKLLDIHKRLLRLEAGPERM